VVRHDLLQQLCLTNILMLAQKYANNAKITATDIYFLQQLFYCSVFTHLQ